MNALLHRYLDWEQAVTVTANRLHDYRIARGVFSAASRLGDGIGWYAILLALAIAHGREALLPVAWMLSTALMGLLLYWAIKKLTARPRPCAVCDELQLSVAPLDKYSFPSGHTLHAVNFSIQLVAYMPELAWLVVPFALLVMASRMVLGLHYLSDVLAGATLGALLAGMALLMQAG
ncbi:MAG: phosphatase PAP2 family protein [Pseudomonadota bacterium]